MKLIFEKSVPGRAMSLLPPCDVETVELPRDLARSNAPRLPEVSETDLSRHYTQLNQHVHGVNCGFYPLGSCTMKYNPGWMRNWPRCQASPASTRWLPPARRRAAGRCWIPPGGTSVRSPAWTI